MIKFVIIRNSRELANLTPSSGGNENSAPRQSRQILINEIPAM